jgi:hypothetical protein
LSHEGVSFFEAERWTDFSNDLTGGFIKALERKMAGLVERRHEVRPQMNTAESPAAETNGTVLLDLKPMAMPRCRVRYLRTAR